MTEEIIKYGNSLTICQVEDLLNEFFIPYRVVQILDALIKDQYIMPHLQPILYTKVFYDRYVVYNIIERHILSGISVNIYFRSCTDSKFRDLVFKPIHARVGYRYTQHLITWLEIDSLLDNLKSWHIQIDKQGILPWARVHKRFLAPINEYPDNFHTCIFPVIRHKQAQPIPNSYSNIEIITI